MFCEFGLNFCLHVRYVYKEKLVLRCIYNLAWYLKALYIICTLHKSPVSTCTLTGDISLPVYKISLLIFYCCMAVICIYMTEYVIIKASAILILWFTNFVSGNTLYILKHTPIRAVCPLHHVDDDNIHVQKQYALHAFSLLFHIHVN